MKKYFLASGLWLLFACLAQGQDTLTLAQLQQAALENYPLARQQALLTQSGELAIANLKTSRWLPQFAVNGQATWQSEVTKLPIELPGFQVPELSKDQYKLTLDASYMLYDGEANRLEKELQRSNTAIEKQGIEVEMNKLKEQVNVFFLNALLAERNSQLIETLQKDLKNRIDKLAANARFGTVAQTTVDALQAEYLQTEQRLAETVAAKKGFKEMLAILSGLPIEANTPLQITSENISINDLSNQRPEMKLYSLQRSQLGIQKQLTGSKIQPRLSAFAQGGIGRPGLNFLNNDFSDFFIGGVKLSWPISTMYNLRRERKMITLRQQIIDSRQESFEQNLALSLRQQQTEIERYAALIEKDRQIVAIRTKLKQSAETQLENGAIAARDYINELNTENQAMLNLTIHQLQWQMAKLQYIALTGN